MKINLNENIKQLRKNAGYTQQQLADAMGVTVGAVSKWESGQSSPDISLLAELADFFEVSVDILLGYNWKKTNMGQLCEDIKHYTHEMNPDDGVIAVRKALQKYPNSFEIVYYSAKLFQLFGMQTGKREYTKDALELYKRALELVDRSEDDKITAMSLQSRIAEAYLALDEVDKAIEYLKKNNSDGINNGLIGFIFSQTNKYDEAMPYLSESFLDCFTEFFRTCAGLSNCHANKGRISEAIGVSELLLKFMEMLKMPGTVGYLDKMSVMIILGIAETYLSSGYEDKAVEYMKKAKAAAERYDLSPDNSLKTFRYIEKSERVLYDDFGTTALNGIQKSVDKSENAKIKEIWDRIKKEE